MRHAVRGPRRWRLVIKLATVAGAVACVVQLVLGPMPIETSSGVAVTGDGPAPYRSGPAP